MSSIIGSRPFAEKGKHIKSLDYAHVLTFFLNVFNVFFYIYSTPVQKLLCCMVSLPFLAKYNDDAKLKVERVRVLVCGHPAVEPPCKELDF